MIRLVSAALRHPTNRTLGEFRRYWSHSHAPLCARPPTVRRFVLDLTLDDAYDDELAPSFDGAAMYWFDDLDSLARHVTHPESVALWTTVIADDAQLFDRDQTWPTDHRRATVVGSEQVVTDGVIAPDMIKAIFISSRRPGLTIEEFSARLGSAHGELVTRLPGIRRYVQTHSLPAAYGLTGILAPTHDACSELWFDSFHAWKAAVGSREWSAVVDSGEKLFARPSAYLIAHDQVLKE
jgi:EthD domain